MSTIQVEGLVKDFDDATHVLKGIDLTVRDGSFTILLGPSGCGKTTLLNLVLGLTPADSGQIIFDGRDLTNVPMKVPQRRSFLPGKSRKMYPRNKVPHKPAWIIKNEESQHLRPYENGSSVY